MTEKIKKTTISMAVAVCAAIMPTVAQDAGNILDPGFKTKTLTAESVYAKAPDYLMPLTSRSTRLDMIDYYNAALETRSQNDFSEECYVRESTPEVIRVTDGKTMEYEVFILGIDTDKPVVGLIETVLTPIPDSTVKFYTTDWEPLPKMQVQPMLADWMAVKGSAARRQVEEALPFIMASYTYDPQTSTIKVTNNMKQFFVADDAPEALSLIKPDLTYVWTGKKFKLVK